MAYRQPRIPEYRESEGAGKYLRALVLFLKDFTMSAWTANNQRKSEIENLRKNMPEMPEIAYPVTSVNGKTGDVQLAAQDVGALGRGEQAVDSALFGGKETSAFAAAQEAVPAGGGKGQVLAKASDEDLDTEWKSLPDGMQMKLLWQNASPGSSFASQTIGLDLSACAAVLIQFRFHSSMPDNAWWEPCPVGEFGEASYSLLAGNGYYAVEVARRFSTAKGAVWFGIGGYNQGTSNNTADNTRAVPVKVYGIRGSAE